MSVVRAKRLARLMVVAGAMMFAPLLVAAPAQAQNYPVETGTLGVDEDDIEPGESVTLSGSGFAPGATITITVQSALQTLDTATADGQGAFSATVTIPSGLSEGTHTLRATGATADGGTLVLSYPFVAGGADDEDDGDGTNGLAETGYPIGLLATVGGSALLAGLGVMTVGVRRRMRTARPSRDGNDA